MLYPIDSPARGKLAISSRPRGGDWLEVDVRNWRQEGVDCVVSLLTPQENDELGLEKEATISRRNNIEFIELPIEDLGVPRAQPEVDHAVEKIQRLLKDGRTVAIHCRQGVGRSGMIAAAVLVAEGVSPGDTMTRISQARGVPVPETPEQVNWIEQLAKPTAH